ncbi:hypothetical protein EDC39_101322 [Geothermobacter ehrlichii]|uniref:Roadblock/LC7 domain-containing protein n=1 Tax=Geothermobacter ehrlichii TaxID=213224 RepID=A0A5D3WMT1_9BACT|nr:roadblock/LC7 domain-containing protein [Geothermobacter ehrlichii]TYP00161.1 hypothetical protein EDC39_101322 [Geothermobacter ehrlichii]
MDTRKASASERFARRISQIDGVASFVLVRRDGRVITHNLDDPDDLAALTTLCGLQADSIARALGFSQIDTLMLRRKEKEHLALFKLDRYFLGIIQRPDSDSEKLAQDVRSFLATLKPRTPRN